MDLTSTAWGSAGGSPNAAPRMAGFAAVRSALQGLIRRGAPDADLERAATLLCAEAKRRGLLIEHVVIALKDAWFSLPEVRQRPRDPSRDDALDRLVAQLISGYYAPLTPGGAGGMAGDGTPTPRGD